MSMTWSRSALPIYLYGYVHGPRREADGSLTIIPERITAHRWGTKEVPSGFFMQPGAENISAVIFNSSGTLSKFNRIGVIAGFGSKRIRLIRRGYAIDPDPDAAEPQEFAQAVDDSYVEAWIEGMDVYHNPRAATPLDPAMLPNAAHHRLLPDGQLESVFPPWHPLASTTVVLVSPTGSRDGSKESCLVGKELDHVGHCVHVIRNLWLLRPSRCARNHCPALGWGEALHWLPAMPGRGCRGGRSRSSR
jgi:hypothetical protein